MKTNKPTHTPTPWTKESSLFRTPATVGILTDDSKKIVVQWQGVTKQELDQVHADAAFIVRAVNVHDEMLMALKLLHDVLENNSIIDWEANSHLAIARRNAYKAIIKAEGDKV